MLATLPLQEGIDGGETIRDLAYMVVLQSIALTALLVIVLPWPPVQRLYGWLLGKPVSAAAPADPGSGR